MEGIARYLTDKRVLVTGAGGSIGSELCRQITHFAPRELIMLDRDESNVQATQISITGRGLLDGPDTVLADIRDEEALRRIFRQRRPQVVFHAAALKHVSLLEQYPDEAWKTNVLGSRNVLQAAAEVGVEVFVNVSTDKAANPTTVLGHSKRMAEKMTAWMSRHADGRYTSVRFGNVFGSRGSMLPLFTDQIRRGGPVTVTDREATRYFMTIPEAARLVIQAAAMGESGQVFVLDMGEPVRIADLVTGLTPPDRAPMPPPISACSTRRRRRRSSTRKATIAAAGCGAGTAATRTMPATISRRCPGRGGWNPATATRTRRSWTSRRCPADSIVRIEVETSHCSSGCFQNSKSPAMNSGSAPAADIIHGCLPSSVTSHS